MPEIRRSSTANASRRSRRGSMAPGGLRSLGGLILLVAAFCAACSDASQPLVGQSGGRAIGFVDVEALDEISGLVASRRNAGVLWLHDDGDIESIFAVDTSGTLLAQLDLGRELEDCEDMELGPGPDSARDYLYLGDIGDNDEERERISIYHVAEPSIGPSSPKRISAQELDRLRLTYPDGKHDAEALLVEPSTGDVFIVTKEDERARVYRAAAASWDGNATVELEHVLTLGVEKVSAGDLSHDGRWIALRREEVGWLWRRHEGKSVVAALRGPAARIAVLGRLQDNNGEAIGFHPRGSGYYTVSEGKRQPIYLFPVGGSE